MADRLLPHLAGADLHDSVGKDGHDLRRLRVRGLLIRLGEVVVADHDGRFIAEARRDGGSAATDGRAIDDIVVDERGGVRQLHRHRRGIEPAQVVRADLGREQHQRGADALAPGREQIGHRRGHHVGVGRDQVAESRLESGQVFANRSEEVGLDL